MKKILAAITYLALFQAAYADYSTPLATKFLDLVQLETFPTRYITPNGAPYTSSNVSMYGVSAESFFVLGGWYFAGKRHHDLSSDFIDKSYSEVKRHFGGFRTTDPAFSGIVIMDIEGAANPKALWRKEYNVDLLAEAFRKRTRVTKERFPNAQIGLWAVVLPNFNGVVFPQRTETLVELAKAGAFEGIDFFVPRLYTEWGVGDESVNLRERYHDMATHAVVETRKVIDARRVDGLPDVDPCFVMPMFGMKNYNPHSIHRGKFTLEFDPDLSETLAVYVDVVSGVDVSDASFVDSEALELVHLYGFWSPSLRGSPVPMEEYFRILFGTLDYNGNYVPLDKEDVAQFFQSVRTFSKAGSEGLDVAQMGADLNHDRKLDHADYQIFSAEIDKLAGR